MTQEEKRLLLLYICAMLPYGTFAQWHHKALNKFRNVKIMKISTYGKNIDDYYINVLCQPEPGTDYEVSIVDIKPYLRPMSSMTKEERKEHDFYCGYKPYDENNGESYLTEYDMSDYMDFLLKHHLDFRGLIEKGLALEAPEEMYNIK